MSNFFTDKLAWAQKASEKLGMPVSLILGQWAHESTLGTSRLARLRNNFGGISVGTSKVPSWSKATGTVPRPADEGGFYLVYPSFGAYVEDYIHVMSNKRYEDVRKAGQTQGLADDYKALGASGYAKSGYAGGASIKKMVDSYKLEQYDSAKKKK